MAIENNNQMADIMALLLGSGRNSMGSGSDLSGIIQALSMMNDPKRKATERNTDINIPELMDQFRNEAYAPRGSGVPYIFTGGSPFPQSPGQQRAEKVGAGLGMSTNMIDAIGSILGAWQDRKKRQG